MDLLAARQQPLPEDTHARSVVVDQCNRVAALVGDVPAFDVGVITGSAQAFVHCAAVADAFAVAVRKICNGSVQNKSACGEPVVKLVLDIVTRYADAPDVLRNAVCAVNNTVVGCDANRVAFVKHGGIAAVCKVLGAHVGSAGISRDVCGVLSAAASAADTRPAVLAAAAEPLVCSAMDAHPEHLELQRRACSFAQHVAQTADGVLALRACGVVDRIKRAQSTFPHDDKLQERAAHALAALSVRST